MSYLHPPLSKNSVRKASKNIASGNYSANDIELVDQWRSSHGYEINTFQAWLKKQLEKTGVDAEFAQRLKRRKTVLDKLSRKRPDGTPLISDVTAMHDLAGCRLIFNSVEDIQSFRSHLHSSKVLKNVNHKLRYDKDKYDYISQPKPSGYRGIHDVFKHYPRPHRKGDTSSLPWHGLLVEIQYRTKVQHAWATALEIADVIDGTRTKFDFEPTERGEYFALASEWLARNHENLKASFLELTRDEIYEKLFTMDSQLKIIGRLSTLKMFGGFEKLKKHNVLNMKITEQNDHSGIDIPSKLQLEVFNFRNANLAMIKTNNLESDPTSLNAVYVRADNPTQLRSAYRNYFNDTEDFVTLLTNN